MKRLLMIFLVLFLLVGCKEEEGMDIATLIVGNYQGGGDNNGNSYSNASITIEKINNSRVKVIPAEGTPVITMEIDLLFNQNIVTGEIASAPAFFTVDLTSQNVLLYIEQFNEGVIFEGIRQN